uniref:Transmembrane protein n=1 Tax=Mesocestoides corti TaxID=53468 RepID=A0A5K3FP46_MESCO
MDCKWPPSTREHIHYGTGHNITLCVRLAPTVSLTNSDTVPCAIDLFRGIQQSRMVSFEDLVKMPLKFWKLLKYPQVYRIYPQEVPLNRIVKAMTVGLPVTYVSRYVGLDHSYLLSPIAQFSRFEVDDLRCWCKQRCCSTEELQLCGEN